MQKVLTGNQLKVIAMVTMTLDHIGVQLFPQVVWLRLVGRLAFPIYAFLIAEGCTHTRSFFRYFASLAAMALLCQAVYFGAMGSLYQCVLVTFSLSVGLCWLIARARKAPSTGRWLLVGLGAAVAVFLCQGLPLLLPHTDYQVDYGILGVGMPVLLYRCQSRREKLAVAAGVLIAMAAASAPLQWCSLLALPLLAMYNGQRGKWRLKWFFYLFYPIHLAVIYLVSLLL